MKSRIYPLLILALAGAAAVGACAVATHAWESENSTSPETVRQLIESELAPGSTKAQIIAFLQDRELDYTAGLATSSDPRLAYTTPFVRAVFRDTCPEAFPDDMFERRCDITVTFELSTPDEKQGVFIDE